MKIHIARTAGFCMGVRRAVEMVLDAPAKHKKPIYTYGPLIHNPQVLSLLEEKGITVLNEIPDAGRGTVLIRAHGVPPEARSQLEAAGFTVIDATCPRVIKVQRIIQKHAAEGSEVIIIGDRDHPEVIGLLGYAGNRGHVVGGLSDLKALPPYDRAIIVAQTTQNTRLFEEIRSWAADHRPDYRIFETICDSTERRQAEVKRLAESVDALVVVGGRNSGNTQRLAEIARESGKPAQHVETEEDLSIEPFRSARRIGITAGASTPNWIIRRIYRSLETLSATGAAGGRRWRFVIQRLLLLTNIYVSLGAGCLCYACTRLQGLPRSFPYILIAILYVQSMHMLNHLTGREEDRYNDPDRGRFYSTHKKPLALLALLTGGAGLILALTVGRLPFLILLVMSLMGLSYNVRLIPERWARGWRYRRIRDIPGSKTVLIASAWGVVTVVLPPLSAWGALTPAALPTLLWATGMVFVRTAFFDILDMQGDRIVGKETLPILLGEKRTLTLLKRMLVGIALVLALSAGFGGIGPLGLLLASCPLLLYWVLKAHEEGRMQPGIRLELLVESHFVLTGILTLGWMFVAGIT